MLSLNKTIHAGHVAKIITGEKHARIRIGINEGYRDADGNWQSSSIFLELVAFKPHLVKLVKEHVTVGQHLYFEGKNGTSTYEKDGETRYSTDIIIEKIQFVSAKNSS